LEQSTRERGGPAGPAGPAALMARPPSWPRGPIGRFDARRPTVRPTVITPLIDARAAAIGGGGAGSDTDDSDASDASDAGGNYRGGQGAYQGGQGDPDDVMRSTLRDASTAALGEVAEIVPWRRILEFYRDPFGCFIYGKRTPNGVRVRRYTMCFATLAHNWWGAFRMQLYLGALLLLWSFHLQVHTGHYLPFVGNVSRFNNYTWPVYVPLWGVPPIAWAEYEAQHASLYGVAPPPLVTPAAPPSPAHPDYEVKGGMRVKNEPTGKASPPPSPSMPPEMPPMPPWMPRIADERAFPHVPLSNAHTKLLPPYPPDLSDENDSSAFMVTAARIFFAAELFRSFAHLAYWVGVWRNEASVPGSHLPQKGCLQVLCP
jgi:hypothetical protein